MQHGQHCPFLNRTDTRCSDNFHLDRLQHAFKYCFDGYQTCPTYLELLVERRVRRSESAVLGEAMGDGRGASALIQLNVKIPQGAHRYAKHVAATADVSAAPGL